MTSELPPGLEPWAPSLGFLTVEAALHIGPLVRRLDAMVRRHDAGTAPVGEPDGWGAISRRGHPDQLLVSEWLLADAAPLEFMRRAASRELLYVARENRAQVARGSIVMVADTGPDQLGAARLVQLAALVVLHRRALARGSELRIGMTGEPADRWHDGDLASQFEAWLGARHHDVPGREHIDERLASLDAGDELWLLAGEALGAACADLNQVVVSREQGWNGDGTATVEIALDGNRDLLPVPSPPLSV